MIRHVLLIANPASRSGRRLVTRGERLLIDCGVSCDLMLTERPGHAAELAAARDQTHDAVFVCGGDGTIMEVAGALAGTDTPIGILAGGTGNLLARALGVPLSIERAVPSLLNGQVQRIDIARLDSGRRFLIAGGVGVDASMVAETPAWLKRRLGVLAYTLVGTRVAVRAVTRKRFVHATVTVDGHTDECFAAAVMVANFGAVLGDRITLGPEIRADDGLLDVCLFCPRTIFDAANIMWRLIRSDFSPSSSMVYRRGRHIEVRTDPPQPFQADGDLVGVTPITIDVEPLGARLLVPRR